MGGKGKETPRAPTGTLSSVCGSQSCHRHPKRCLRVPQLAAAALWNLKSQFHCPRQIPVPSRLRHSRGWSIPVPARPPAQGCRVALARLRFGLQTSHPAYDTELTAAGAFLSETRPQLQPRSGLSREGLMRGLPGGRRPLCPHGCRQDTSSPQPPLPPWR